MAIDEVELLELAAQRPDITVSIKKSLGLSAKDDPLNVPLEALDWRQGKLQLYAVDSPTVAEEADIFVAKLPTPAVGIDSTGHRFLARRGDYLVRNDDNTYSLVKRGVTRG